MAQDLAPVTAATPVTGEGPGRRAALVAAALMVPICLVYLWFPGDGDQTLFELGARRLLRGEVYYRDFWDVKQPGIYWFYELGTAMGPGVLGPRLLELAGVGLGGFFVWRLTGIWRLQALVRVVSPALVIGSYVLLSHRNGVTQIEGLMNPWLVALVLLTWPAEPAGGEPRSVRRWALAGLVVGVLGVFKLFYLPIPAVLLLGALVASRGPLSSRAARFGAAAGGAAVPLLATVAYFALNGDFALLRVTTLLPFETVGQLTITEGWHRWKDLVINPIPPLAVLAFLTARRRGTVVREVTLALTALTAWVLSTQQYPGAYRLLMLAAPLGLLAVIGADVLWRWAARPAAGAGRRQVAVLATAAVLCLPLTWGPVRLAQHAGQVPWGLGQDDRNALEYVLLDEHHDRQAAPVKGLIAPGTAIFVFGHAQIYEEVDGYQAIPISGWDVQGMPRRVWRERDRELLIARPEWVYVEARYPAMIDEKSPGFAGLLRTRYKVVSQTQDGTWFRTDDVGTRVTNELDEQPA